MQRSMRNKGTKGSFQAAATKAGMSMPKFARHVLANKDRFSAAMVKKANFYMNTVKPA